MTDETAQPGSREIVVDEVFLHRPEAIWATLVQPDLMARRLKMQGVRVPPHRKGTRGRTRRGSQAPLPSRRARLHDRRSLSPINGSRPGHGIGPAYRLGEGLRLAESEAIDFAVLDVNLNGARSLPIAAVLIERGIPFVFATGYGTTGVETVFPNVPVVSKPFTSDRLIHAIDRARS